MFWMQVIVSPLLTFAAIVILATVGIFFAEVMAAVALFDRANSAGLNTRIPSGERVAVMIPAHNEGMNLLPTIADVKRQTISIDTLLVIADNCTDDTAHIASAQGAEVVERHDPAKRGKGYALDFGLQHLESSPPKIVVMIDADCRLANNAIQELVKTCVATCRPIQALYLMTAPAEMRNDYRVAEFAWRVKNWLRPSGLSALRLPCQLMGTGMAFPFDVVRGINLASGSIVEDLKLGLDLTANGYPPVFCPSAVVTSEFAYSSRAARTQRERWEGGHIGMIVSTVPGLFLRSVADRNWKLLVLTLDLIIPPLSLLALLVLGMFSLAGLSSLFGSSLTALMISTFNIILFGLATFVAWLKCGRDLVPISAAALEIPRYLVGKAKFYRAKLFKRTDAQWIRTDRRNSE
jgi:cellulose synthase/poly-beta-1,6-N-acetylglucosamine synthase-like glycosyltransferase